MAHVVFLREVGPIRGNFQWNYNLPQRQKRALKLQTAPLINHTQV